MRSMYHSMAMLRSGKRLLALLLLLLPVAAVTAALPSAPAIGLSAVADPPTVAPGAAVTYRDALTNAGDEAGLGVTLAHTLPAGFSYAPGSARVYRDGILISSAEPAISGRTLSWSGLAAAARRGDSFYGINTMVQERCNISYTTWQLNHARDLMGYGAWVKQLFYGIVRTTTGPQPCWIDYVNAAYDRGLQPVVRLAGEHGGSYWHKPAADAPGNYSGIAQAFARVVSGLPRRDGRKLCIQLWNEPNLNLEWGGAANATEYGQFLEQTARAIRTATGGDARIVILNAPLSPGADIAPSTFMSDMFRTVPNSRWAFDIWASHAYPGNYPPELNNHRGAAGNIRVSIDSYLPELQLLAANGRPHTPIFLSETGYLLGQVYDYRYPAVNEANRADYISRAFRDYWRVWPEVIGVAPYELSDPGGAWSGWNWVEGDNSRHAQYNSVLALDKSNPYADSRLVVQFQARAAVLPGTYTSDVAVSAANFGVAPLTGAAAVVVVEPTPTPTPTPRPTATSTVTPTPTITPVARPVTLAPVGREPRGVAVDSATGLAYVAHHGAGSASVIDGATGAVVRTLDLGAAGGSGAAYDPTTGLLYVANQLTDQVSRVPGSGSTAAEQIAVAAQPRGVAVDPSGGRVIAANSGAGTVSLFEGATGEGYLEAPAGGRPAFIALDPGRGRFYVTHNRDATVGMYDLATGALLKTLPTGAGPYGIGLDASRNRLYTADRDGRSVTIIDLANDTIVKHMPLNCHPHQVAANPASGHLFVVCAGDLQMHIYDEDTTLWLAWAPVGRGAEEGIAVDPVTGRVFVSNSLDDTVSILQDTGFRPPAAAANYLPLYQEDIYEAPGPVAAAPQAAGTPVAPAPMAPVAAGAAETPQPVAPAPVAPAGGALVADHASGHVYVAGLGGVQRCDPATGQVIAAAAVGRELSGGGLAGMVLDAAAGRLYVAEASAGAVYALDTSTLEQEAAASGLAGPGGLALAGDRLFIADTPAGAVRVLAAGDLQTVAEVAVGSAPYAVAALPELGRVFVGLTGSDEVAVVDAASAVLLASTHLGGLGFPQALAADPGRGVVYALYVLAPHYHQVAVLDGRTGALTGVIPASLDRPLTGAMALALGGAGSDLLFVSAAEGLQVYDLAAGRWEEAPLARTGSPAPIFGLAVDAKRRAIYWSEAEGLLTPQARSCIIPFIGFQDERN